MYKYEYPRPSVTVDCVIFGFDPGSAGLRVVLIKRADDPFKGKWALPGGFINVNDEDQGESLEEAAQRELNEETGLKINYLEQLYTFGQPGRDPRGRVISVAYFALVNQNAQQIIAGSDAAEVKWLDVKNVKTLAFDHNKILDKAVERLHAKIKYSPVGFNLMPETFTMRDLHHFYEALLMKKIDFSNFRKKILVTDLLIGTGSEVVGQHRPAPIYKFSGIDGIFNLEF